MGLQFDWTINVGQVLLLLGIIITVARVWERFQRRIENVEKVQEDDKREQVRADEEAETRRVLVEELRVAVGSVLEWRKGQASITEQQVMLLKTLGDSMIEVQQWREWQTKLTEQQAAILDGIKESVSRLTTMSELYMPRLPILEREVAELKRKARE